VRIVDKKAQKSNKKNKMFKIGHNLKELSHITLIILDFQIWRRLILRVLLKVKRKAQKVIDQVMWVVL